MKFTKLPSTAFQNMQLNAGVLVKEFAPETGTLTLENILGATSGGIKFTATPTFSDRGEDVDNCPKNTKELKELDTWEAKMSGTFVTVTPDSVKSLLAAADVSDTKITPRGDLKDEDFSDIWFVGDYSDMNGETNGGFCAIRMMDSLSTAGFSLQTNNKNKGQFAFEYMAHYTHADQTRVPFEVYVKAGTAEAMSVAAASVPAAAAAAAAAAATSTDKKGATV